MLALAPFFRETLMTHAGRLLTTGAHTTVRRALSPRHSRRRNFAPDGPSVSDGPSVHGRVVVDVVVSVVVSPAAFVTVVVVVCVVVVVRGGRGARGAIHSEDTLVDVFFGWGMTGSDVSGVTSLDPEWLRAY